MSVRKNKTIKAIIYVFYAIRSPGRLRSPVKKPLPLVLDRPSALAKTPRDHRDPVSLMPSIPRSMSFMFDSSSKSGICIRTVCQYFLFHFPCVTALTPRQSPLYFSASFYITLLALLYHMHDVTARQISGHQRRGWRLYS